MEGRKRALLQEFDSCIAPKKLELEATLPAIWKQCYGVSSLKGHGSSAHGLIAQKPRTEDQQRILDGLFKECDKIVKKLIGIKSGAWFKQPVNLKAVPTYLNFIQHPMDLGTVKSNLQDKLYNSPLEFRDHVNLIWDNCAIFNAEGTPARVDGETCRGIWSRAWRDSQIEERWKKLQFEIDPSVAPLHERVGVLSMQLNRMVQALPPSNKPEGPGRDMTFVEKRKLSIQLGRLSSDQLRTVLEIVSEDPKVKAASSDEMEVELDELRSETLWKLSEVINKPGNKVAGGSESRPGPASTPPPPSHAAEKRPPPQSAASIQSSGAGISHSDSGEHSPGDVKGSTMDDPRQGASAFVRDPRNVVDESATNPKEQSLFVKDRAAARKDVNINAANWDSLTTDQQETGTSEPQPQGAEGGGDDVWKSFQSIAEKKQQQEEEQRLEAERAEKLKREEQEKLLREEEERNQKLKEEEERIQAENQKQRDEQMAKELAEIEAKAGTANLSQQNDIAILNTMPAPAADGLAAVGLEYKDDDEDMNFEDE
ncbi:hypothetical protein CEUSTIGMA_g8266.t1 [Chlamydomonas eustigma]|uniref:Bromo domain-containing protein n=1 Tax=Chlamydomonas eustigma TaxID=1157962 RepID=A0A250XCM8_9CHLO|nr:hypothetical protein CEUSTIGMA_g8266.t1 [Chlamydomonas eustigma]|eukprot:GAX80831.1 hypothetical protein CEUSTIGMA_g8266.t1 [Chlamydomonas eustigma]